MKKKFTLPLLALALLLWGAIFYRIFAGIGDDAAGIPVAAAIPAKEPAIERMEDDSLLLGYRDPFLEHAEATPDILEEDQLMAYEEYVEDTPYVDWSQIQYLGSVNASSGGKTVSLVNINGKEYMLKAGDTVDGYTLVGQVGNSIAVSYEGQMGTITIQGNNEILDP